VGVSSPSFEGGGYRRGFSFLPQEGRIFPSYLLPLRRAEGEEIKRRGDFFL